MIMNRLVQGDVGSGKTVVAEIALYKAVRSGFQGAMMAPTELLAKQHFAGLSKNFAAHGIKVGMLTGSMTAREKREVLEALSTGEIQILVGTHAIIQPDVSFKNLGLVITDEQHRFGVKQRNALSEKGNNPHVLVMTATPIPRTLAVILYGDLDVSAIDELPPGRQRIITRAVDETRRHTCYDFVEKELEKGRQAYVSGASHRRIGGPGCEVRGGTVPGTERAISRTGSGPFARRYEAAAKRFDYDPIL